MTCILNYCSERIIADLVIVALYGTALMFAVGLSFLAKSRSIRTAALLVALSWAFGVFTFFYINVEAYFLGAVMIDSIIAYHFWRMAKIEIFPAPLCLILLLEITIIVFAEAVGFSRFVTALILNRLFELTLLYLIGCSLFRIYVLRLQERSDPPPSDWRVRFVMR